MSLIAEVEFLRRTIAVGFKLNPARNNNLTWPSLSFMELRDLHCVRKNGRS